MTDPASNPQVVGLIYDAVGIFILGVPAAYRMTQEIVAQSGTYWGTNLHLAKALAASRIDISIGSVILLAGFASQLVGNLGFVYESAFGWSLCSVCLAFLIFYFPFLRFRLTKILLSRVEARIAAEAESESQGKTSSL